MQKFINDLKTCAVTTWPTSEKEYLKEPVFQFRISKDADVVVGDFVEVSSKKYKNATTKVVYKIEEILEQKDSSAYPKMKILKCRFSKSEQVITD
jgi:hypothetical protein